MQCQCGKTPIGLSCKDDFTSTMAPNSTYYYGQSQKKKNNKPISRGNNYFSQSGGEATKPNPTQFLDIILGLAFNYQILR
jgi:hypothetical protein